MEVARTVMVLGGNLERWLKRREQERLDKAITEARLEIQRKWAEWKQRRLDSEARGEPFTGLPPDASTDANGKV